MSVLSDRTIRRNILSGNLKITPFHDGQLQAASYDITLGTEFLIPGQERSIDPFERDDDAFERVTVTDHPILMPQHACLLASTQEFFEIPNNMIARVEGKSSLARLGLLIHQTAGFIDPGFKGHITLEISFVFPGHISLYPGMLIGQIAFQFLDTSALRPYGSESQNSKYQNQQGPQPSRYYLNTPPDSHPWSPNHVSRKQTSEPEPVSTKES